MNIKKIIKEEIKKILESDYYDNFPDFLDPLNNPNLANYPPIGTHTYGSMVKEDSLNEEYPEMFKMEYFKTLNTFSERIKYCEYFLKRISSGSSRIVYKIDEEKVLKLAKNKKGLAQNKVESDSSNFSDLKGLIAEIYRFDENFLWVEMELAKKMSQGDFKRITGFSFKDFSIAIHNYGVDTINPRGSKTGGVSEEILGDMWENEFVSSVLQYMPNYSIPSGDLMKTSSYGIVNREWGEDIILIDYGFNKEVHNNYYS